jgi:8-oxo-dGTP diphosphatase
MREWVVGFAMNEDEADLVALVKKNRPEWQAGLWNGIGGKVEPGDLTLEAAMRREFLEETGVMIVTWEHLVVLEWEQGRVYFMRAFVPGSTLSSIRQTTDEQVGLFGTSHVTAGRLPVIPNLRWLVPLAAHRADTYAPFTITETDTDRLKVGRAGA